jgi:hypothetical protein
VKLALGIPCWQDGPEMIEKVIASLDGCHDLLLVADGVIDGVESSLPDVSDLSFLDPGPGVVVEQRRWKTQMEKRDWLLQQARAHGCDWLIQLDSDERLHEPQLLKVWLDRWGAGAFPIPFEFEKTMWPYLIGATWKCLHVPSWRRVVCQGAFLEHMNGQVYLLVPPEGRLPSRFVEGLPYVSHHPEERPEGRRQIRLSVLEDQLEPPVVECVPYWTHGFGAHPCPPGAVPGFFCDQCGRRYSTPGTCTVQHEPAVVRPLPDGELDPLMRMYVESLNRPHLETVAA